MKKADIESEDQLKKYIEIVKKEDSVFAEKLNKFYEKSCELDRISEDILKYILDVDKLNGALNKFRSALHPLEHKLIDSVKKFEVSNDMDYTDLILNSRIRYIVLIIQLILYYLY